VQRATSSLLSFTISSISRPDATYDNDCYKKTKSTGTRRSLSPDKPLPHRQRVNDAGPGTLQRALKLSRKDAGITIPENYAAYYDDECGFYQGVVEANFH